MTNTTVYTGGQVGTDAAIVMVNASGTAPSSPGTVISDTLFLAKPTSGIMVGVAGTLAVVFTDGTGGAFKVIPGVVYPWAVKQFRASGMVTLVAGDLYLLYGPRIR